jgi:hypothetical protein
MEISGVKKVDVRAVIIRADGSQEDQGTIASWESSSSSSSLIESVKNIFRRK